MANSYTQLYVHIVFAVRFRQNLIRPEFKTELYKYITGVVQNSEAGHKMIAINGMPDHIHILVGMRPVTAVSDLVREIKASSSRFINDRGWIRGRFEWQRGFGAFSVSQRGMSVVARYIERQEEHHREKAFYREYVELLEKYAIEYDERYLFDKP